MNDLEITVEEVASRLASSTETVIVDVREEFELSRGILPGARHVPMSQLLERVAEIPTQGDVVIYCEHGVRSYDVVAWLRQQGRTNVRSMSEGFAQWSGTISPYNG